MYKLNLPSFPLKVKSKENKHYIFDIIRKKNIVLTDEEWVRQNFIHYLIQVKKYPKSLIAVEKKVVVNKLTKRTDILIFDNTGAVNILVECKAPSIKINQQTFDQIARYNLNINANYLILTNGLEHIYCQIDTDNKKYLFLKDIPSYL